MHTLLLLATLTTPPLSFISTDCTQYGSPETPYLVMSHRGTGATLPYHELHRYPVAVSMLRQIQAVEHERWYDPACES
mgnify:CR=1 FL=1